MSGTEDYEVESELDGDEIAEMYCDWLYAMEGGNVKDRASEDVEGVTCPAKQSKNKKEDEIQEGIALARQDPLFAILF